MHTAVDDLLLIRCWPKPFLTGLGINTVARCSGSHNMKLLSLGRMQVVSEELVEDMYVYAHGFLARHFWSREPTGIILYLLGSSLSQKEEGRGGTRETNRIIKRPDVEPDRTCPLVLS